MYAAHRVLSYNHPELSHSSRWLNALLLGCLYGRPVNVCPCVGLHVSHHMCPYPWILWIIYFSVPCLTTEVLEERPFTETLSDKKAKAQQGSMLCSLARNKTTVKTPSPFFFSKTTHCITQPLSSLARTKIFMMATNWVGGEGSVCGIKASNLLKLTSEQKRKI